MTDMGKWQIVSFISRISAMAIGLIQSFVIIRILTVTEWGTIQLAASIGGALGVYQHLGLASASTRQIAAAKNDDDIFKIFFTSVVIRYVVTLPLAIGLFLYSEKIAVGIYNNSALILPLKIYGLTLLVLGFQSILNSVISGTKKFKKLFIYQIVISIINVIIFIPLVIYYRVDGYFWAYLIFNIINTLLLGFLAFSPLKGKIKIPSKKDFRILFKEIFTISIALYIIKILAINWEKLGTNVLGIDTSPEQLAIFAFALLYAKKILSISDAVTDVSLPILSEKYSQNINDFKLSFIKNFDKVFGFILISAAFACYWAPELITILVGGDKYDSSYKYILPILLAFVLYSFIDIIKSSVFVPARLVKEMALSFVILLFATVIGYFSLKPLLEPLTAMAYALSIGTLTSILYVLWTLTNTLKLHFLTHDHWLILLQFVCMGWLGIYMSIEAKAFLFPVFTALLIWGLFISKILHPKDFDRFFKYLNFSKKFRTHR